MVPGQYLRPRFGWFGLYFMGQLFQSTLSSALIGGMGRDAEYLAEHLRDTRSQAGRAPAVSTEISG